MPQDLPGFYYDAEKNRYFPIKGPIPGTSRNTSSASSNAKKSVQNSNQASNARWGMRIKVVTMLQVRELCGNAITSNKRKVNFQEQCQKIQASKPTIWRYHGTKRIADGALEHIHVDIDTPDGLTKTDMLLTGGLNGALSLYEVGKVGESANSGVNCMPDRVWPLNIEKQASSVKFPGNLWRAIGASVQMPSNVSCIKMSGKHPQATGSASSAKHALITTLGSETSGGSVYLMNLSEPLEYVPTIYILNERIDEISIFKSTIWAGDSSCDGSRAVIGTNVGAALVHTETGRRSWICRSESDVFSLQLDYSGNIVLCGLRNGAIVTVDARQKPEELSARLTTHQIPYTSHKSSEPSSGRGQRRKKQRFELKGNICPSRIITMPSSVSCLALLEQYDQYFLASSMDGSIKLYDRRMIQKVAVQSYEGNVNSHHRIQLGIDPSERFFMSGGEDFYLRIWSIKSGEMLFEDRFMDSVPSVVCWPGGGQDRMRRDGDYGENNCSTAWFGSQEGLFCVQY